MLQTLTHDILPVFSMLALGLLLGRAGKIRRDEAATVNRITFLILQPPLIFTLISAIDWQDFRADALGAYALAQVVLFTLTYQLCRRLFGRERLESWLLAMATIFVNTLLYIWPISVLIYGEAEALPVTAISAWDAAVSFAFFIVTTDLMANPGAGPGGAIRRIAVNPVLIAIALGLGVSLADITVPEPILTACRFAGAGAAPLTLFALGVILSGHALRPTPLVASVSALKLVAFPLLTAAGVWMLAPPEHWQTLFILAAAGPSGAMAFALALLYRVRTDAIAPVIVWTSVLSLLSLAWLA